MKVSVKVGDTVLVNSGKDSGKKGKVLAVKKNKDSVRLIVEGVNIITKAKKARTAQDKSEIIKTEGTIDVSNVNVICSKCDKAIRVKHTVVDGKKVRVCPKCGAVLDVKFSKDAKVKKAAKAETAEAKETKKAEKTAKTEKSKVTKSVKSEEKATKVAVAKKPQTGRSAQRGV
ncbi:MAG: 50S ribosomal protein L24 [Clostridia bacterium]|nr:50S ribosomal protein L24 [Clostridia bacterium]